ncbi:MAG: DUF4351 domain-containing protein [Hormoscilla sp. GUM202]|nr:DUF4351 domain-containing protein [Hormoscilla sp. GUM202]
MPYDNLCKYLCEKYPEAFSSWIYGQRTRNVEVLKTELTMEPIRADSVTFLRTTERILHLEFQLQLPQRKPMPLRMLNYFVRLHWDYELPVTQVVIWLKPTTNPAVFETQFKLESTQHEYKVIRIWEESPEIFLQEPALLPLATLAATENSSALLGQVAQQVSKIEEPAERDEISACTQILAGLRFKKDVIRNFFREEIMQESVIYQDIIQKGMQKGVLETVTRLLTRRFGTLEENLQQRLQQLPTTQLQDLAEELLDFSSVTNLVNWLRERQM